MRNSSTDLRNSPIPKVAANADKKSPKPDWMNRLQEERKARESRITNKNVDPTLFATLHRSASSQITFIEDEDELAESYFPGAAKVGSSAGTINSDDRPSKSGYNFDELIEKEIPKQIDVAGHVVSTKKEDDNESKKSAESLRSNGKNTKKSIPALAFERSQSARVLSSTTSAGVTANTEKKSPKPDWMNRLQEERKARESRITNKNLDPALFARFNDSVGSQITFIEDEDELAELYFPGAAKLRSSAGTINSDDRPSRSGYNFDELIEKEIPKQIDVASHVVSTKKEDDNESKKSAKSLLSVPKRIDFAGQILSRKDNDDNESKKSAKSLRSIGKNSKKCISARAFERSQSARVLSSATSANVTANSEKKTARPDWMKRIQKQRKAQSAAKSPAPAFQHSQSARVLSSNTSTNITASGKKESPRPDWMIRLERERKSKFDAIVNKNLDPTLFAHFNNSVGSQITYMESEEEDELAKSYFPEAATLPSSSSTISSDNLPSKESKSGYNFDELIGKDITKQNGDANHNIVTMGDQDSKQSKKPNGDTDQIVETDNRGDEQIKKPRKSYRSPRRKKKKRLPAFQRSQSTNVLSSTASAISTEEKNKSNQEMKVIIQDLFHKNKALQAQLEEEARHNRNLRAELMRKETRLSNIEPPKKDDIGLRKEIERLQMELSKEKEASKHIREESQLEIAEVWQKVDTVREEASRHKEEANHVLYEKIKKLEDKLKSSKEDSKRLRTELNNVEVDWDEKLRSKEKMIEFYLKEISTLKANGDGKSATSQLGGRKDKEAQGALGPSREVQKAPKRNLSRWLRK